MHVFHAYTKPARIQKKKSSPAGEYPNNLFYDKELQSHGIPQRRIAQKCIQMANIPDARAVALSELPDSLSAAKLSRLPRIDNKVQRMVRSISRPQDSRMLNLGQLKFSKASNDTGATIGTVAEPQLTTVTTDVVH